MKGGTEVLVRSGDGLKGYYKSKIEELELKVKDKSHNLRRLEAQRNELNTQVRLLREELQLLQEPGSFVGDVIKAGPVQPTDALTCINQPTQKGLSFTEPML
ncbi:AAA domain-containing protein [Haematococcus lacustris]|uniref:AAA domain-containing protein n=1 Tax=Haematococcus lacustris TaxID=44745 RepID=A0A699ZSE1_HAELA|nr:AAA domain-containing protein [Haematococcus lacustris]